MQADSVLSLSPIVHLYPPSNRYAQDAAKVVDDFSAKLKFDAFVSETEEQADEGCSKRKDLDELLRDESAGAGENDVLRDESEVAGENDEEEDGDEEEEDEEEFSFACTNPGGSPIAADDVFVDGQIRPVYPIFNRDLLFADVYDGDSKAEDATSSALRPPLRKLFVGERGPPRPSSSSESEELEGEGPYCAWSGKAVETSPEELSKKSNSTGFSKLRRFRDLVLRSNSDGHDAFVFLHHPSGGVKPTSETTARRKNENVEKAKVAAGAGKAQSKVQERRGGGTASSAHEKHYVKSRARRQGDKRKSYLPYKQDLVGFFTNVNGFSRNVHPF